MTVPVAHVPANATRVERGWSGLMVEGPLDFALVGVLAELSGALADASISLCAISTWDTDYLLVRAEDRQRVTETLERQGWTFEYTGNSHPS